MPKVPLAVVSSSSSDSVVSDGEPENAFYCANWTALSIDSFESLPFSELSHSPYGAESYFLDSVSHVGVSARRISINNMINAERGDLQAISPKTSMRSARAHVPCHLVSPQSKTLTRSSDVSSESAAVKLPSVPTGSAALDGEGSPLPMAACANDNGVEAVRLSLVAQKGRRPKPLRRFHRELQMEAARWLEDDRDTALLVRREVESMTPQFTSAATRMEKSPFLISVTNAEGFAIPDTAVKSSTTSTAGMRDVLAPVASMGKRMFVEGKPSEEGPNLLTGAVQSARPHYPLLTRVKRKALLTGDGATAAEARQSPVLLEGAEVSATAQRRVSSRGTAEPSARLHQQQQQSTPHTSPISIPSGSGPQRFPPLLHSALQLKTEEAAALLDEGDSPYVKSVHRRHRRQRLQQKSPDFALAPSPCTRAEAQEVEAATVQPEPPHRSPSPDLMAGVILPRTAVVRLPLTSSQQPSVTFTTPLPQCKMNDGGTPREAQAVPNLPQVPVLAGTPGPSNRRQTGPAPLPRDAAAKTALDDSTTSQPTPAIRKEHPRVGACDFDDAPQSAPAHCVTAEKLVAFVRAVPDAEVLHLIHEYLLNHQEAVPPYRLAATACQELLEGKEKALSPLLPAVSDGASAVEVEGSRKSVPFTHDHDQANATAASPSAPPDDSDTAEAETASPTGQSEAQRLLAAVMEAEKSDGSECDADADEFDDYNFCRVPHQKTSPFRFGEPTVSGLVTPIFDDGQLYKIKTSTGEYHFYNDTLQEVMMVRVRCQLQGNETINERAMQVPLVDSGNTEITIAVLPEETNFFIAGVPRLSLLLAKRVPVPDDYICPSVTAAQRTISTEINAVRKKLGKWSRASDQAAYLKCCLKHHMPFTDLNFRPCAESLCRPQVDAVFLKPLTWRRPESYVYPPEVAQTRLFRGEISCFLVQQGELGNHTVVAAMAAVAQYPEQVRWMFRHPVSALLGKMERAQGCYRVNLLHNGWWRNIIVDDYLPASLRGPLFARCAEDTCRLWVPLMEKAYAKSLGSYAATCLVDVMDAVADFTGFPVRFLDSMWAAAAQTPEGAVSRCLFHYLEESVRAGCTVLLFTPAPTGDAANFTASLSRRCTSRQPCGKGVVPQFLPGHIYFLCDTAFYDELDLRIVRLKNPWTWETKRSERLEKKWRFTSWYDTPDASPSVANLAEPGPRDPIHPQGLPPRPALGSARPSTVTPEVAAHKGRKGTMWVEWNAVLAAFGGGGVCYTLWNRHQYRVKGVFVRGRPRFVLELTTQRKVELFVTLSLETVSDTLDNYGAIVSSHPRPPCGTAISVVQHDADQTAKVLCESCEDIERVAERRTYVAARDVSMKVAVHPTGLDYPNGALYIVPLLDPAQAEAAEATVTCPATSSREDSSGSASHGDNGSASDVHFVLSIVSDTTAIAAAGEEADLSMKFVSLPQNCGVFTGSAKTFRLEGVTPVVAEYQVRSHSGVATYAGTSIANHDRRCSE